MCVINKEAAYEVIVTDNMDNDICTIGFSSASLVCRFLDEFNFRNGNCCVVRRKDDKKLDIDLMLSVWRSPSGI